jgi:ABC-type polysaccharide/polyol phosphate transport system ATPase subunit
VRARWLLIHAAEWRRLDFRHNGAGKSTPPKVLPGCISPICPLRIEGRVSPLFNSAPAGSHDNGYENITTCGLFLGMTAEEINRKLPDIVAFCELGEYLDCRCELPNGMVARGLRDCNLDRPTFCPGRGLGAGDAAFAERAARMKALIQRTRIPVLASHPMRLSRDAQPSHAAGERQLKRSAGGRYFDRYQASDPGAGRLSPS